MERGYLIISILLTLHDLVGSNNRLHSKSYHAHHDHNNAIIPYVINSNNALSPVCQKGSARWHFVWKTTLWSNVVTNLLIAGDGGVLQRTNTATTLLGDQRSVKSIRVTKNNHHLPPVHPIGWRHHNSTGIEAKWAGWQTKGNHAADGTA